MPKRGLLHQLPFRALWSARMVSFLGDGVAKTALVLLTARQGPGAVAIVLIAGTLPRFLGPMGGALADRWDRRSLMRMCAVGQALVMAVITAALPPVPVLAVLVAAEASLATAFNPASASCVPQIVDATQLTRANSLIATALTVQVAAGPAIGGLLVGVGGSRTAFAVDAATFLAAAVLLGRLPTLPPTIAAISGVWASTVDGLRYVGRLPALRSFVAGTLVFVTFAAVDNVALVFLVKDRLGGSATTYGYMQTCFGIGMLVASIFLGIRRRTLAPAPLMLIGSGGTAVGSLLTALAPGLAAAGGAQTLAGIGNGIENVATTTYVQQLVPARMLGRVVGVVSTAGQVGNGLAYAVGAPLVAGLGPRNALIVAAFGAVFGLLILLAGFRTPQGIPPGQQD